MKSLLQRESDVYLYFSDKEKKDNEIYKLRITIITIIVSELTQAAFIFIHESYYSAPIQKCPLMNFEQDKLSANILVFAYRLVTVYLPLVALLWMTWLSSSHVELQFREVKFDDDRF